MSQPDPQLQEPEPDVKRVCLDCEFATADEAKADAHYSLTGHAIAIDFVPYEFRVA